MKTAKIAGRELPMAFDVRAWVEELEPTFGCFQDMVDKLSGRDKPITAGLDMLAFLFNAGQRKQGSKERFTRAWLADQLEPVEVPGLIRVGQEVIFASFAQEEREDTGPVDEVLMELAKKDPGSA